MNMMKMDMNMKTKTQVDTGTAANSRQIKLGNEIHKRQNGIREKEGERERERRHT